jgi:hypothetical protein
MQHLEKYDMHGMQNDTHNYDERHIKQIKEKDIK